MRELKYPHQQDEGVDRYVSDGVLQPVVTFILDRPQELLKTETGYHLNRPSEQPGQIVLFSYVFTTRSS